MAERLGEAVLELRTDDSRYSKAVARAEVGARKLDRGLAKTGGTARRLGARLTALGGRVRALGRSFFNLRNAAILAAGVTGLAFLTKKVLDSADAIAKSADVIGIGTETLQKWTFAAGQAGVGSDKFVQGLKTFGKQIGDARAGTGTMVTILGKMDPALLKALQRTNSVEEAFILFIKAIDKLPTQMDKLALAAAGFGRGAGAAMVNVAKDGGKAFFDWAEALIKAGGVIPDKLLRPAEGAVDTLSFLTTVVKAQLTSALLRAAPTITRLGKAFSDALPGIIEWVENAIEIVGNFIKANLQMFKWKLLITAAVLVLTPFVTALGWLVAVLKAVVTVLGVGGVAIAGLSLPILAIIAVLVLAGGAFFFFRDEIMEALGQAFDFIVESVKSVIDWLGDFVDFLAKAATAAGEFFGLVNRGIKAAAAGKNVGFTFGGATTPRVRGNRATIQIGGFQRGGSFTVPGSGGIDSQFVPIMATPGERVTVTPEGGMREGARFNIDARGADLGVERRIERAMQRAVRLASAQAGGDFAAALRASGV